jgi:hypothetical protein
MDRRASAFDWSAARNEGSPLEGLQWSGGQGDRPAALPRDRPRLRPRAGNRNAEPRSRPFEGDADPHPEARADDSARRKQRRGRIRSAQPADRAELAKTRAEFEEIAAQAAPAFRRLLEPMIAQSRELEAKARD